MRGETVGDTVEDVLSYVEYDSKEIRKKLRETAENAVREGLIKPKERKYILNTFECGLNGYTYYEKQGE